MLCCSHMKIWNLANHIKNKTKSIKILDLSMKKWKLSVLCSLFHFFHVIYKISNLNTWNAKHLAQVCCTEVTLWFGWGDLFLIWIPHLNFKNWMDSNAKRSNLFWHATIKPDVSNELPVKSAALETINFSLTYWLNNWDRQLRIRYCHKKGKTDC